MAILAAVGALLSVGLLLFVARTQARAMFRYVDLPPEMRTARPESLTLAAKARVLLAGVTVPRPQNSTDPRSAFGWEFESLEIDNGRGDRLEIWRIPTERSETTGPPEVTAPLALMFHGYAGSKESLLPAAAQLRQLGCECWLVDFFGSGGSSGDYTTFGWVEADDVVAVFEEAQASSASDLKKRRPIVLYGTSMGGSAVMRAMADLGVDADAALVESVFSDLRGTVAHRFHLMQLPAFPAADLLLYFGGRDLNFDPRDHCPLDYAARIDVPTLLLHGERDTRAPLADARRIRENFSGPASLVAFDAEHQTLAASHPEQWRNAVRDFLLGQGIPTSGVTVDGFSPGPR